MSEQRLTALQRRTIGSAWVEMGLGEHASIAAFAKLILELMAVGAPPHLLEEANRALRDEIEHCRLCFERAAEFNEFATSPGSLKLDDVAIDTDPAAVLRNAIVEGCFTETISAYWAVEASTRAVSGDDKAPLTRIASDELRHSKFSWNLVRWLLSEFPLLKEVADQSFDRALADFDSARTARDQGVPVPAGYGHLDASLRLQIADRTLRDVILPSRKEMMTSVGP